jgi:hypothetical protein
MRGERGQTAAELLGGLLVVSVVIGALATTDVGAKIRGEGERIVCEIGGGECGSAPPAGLEESDLQGPSLTERPLIALPFPGSVSVACTYDVRQPETCTPESRPGVSVQATGEIKVERTPTTLDANGCPWQTLSIGATLKLVANARAKGAKVGGGLSAYVGRGTNYGVTVTPDGADAIARGDRTPPNPVDPRTLGTGESIVLTKDFYRGVGAQASYRALQLEMGYDKGTRVSSGVRRISPTTVRVLVGDEDFVRSALKLGVDLKVAAVALGNTKELAGGKLHAVDIDISSAAGWGAYQAFLQSGRLPRNGAPGTSNQTRAETVKYTDTTKLEAKFGPITVGGRGGSSEGRWTHTRNADGSTDDVENVRYNGTSIAISTHHDASGRQVGAPTYSLLLHDVHESYLPYLYERTGRRMPADPSRDVRLDFTEAQLELLQQLALEKLADKIELNRDGRPTPEELARSLRENHGIVKYKGVSYSFGGLETELGMAADPRAMLLALYRTGFMSPNNVVEMLSLLLVGEQRDLPATIKDPTCG